MQMQRVHTLLNHTTTLAVISGTVITWVKLPASNLLWTGKTHHSVKSPDLPGGAVLLNRLIILAITSGIRIIASN
jgi:hypothetical protein